MKIVKSERKKEKGTTHWEMYVIVFCSVSEKNKEGSVRLSL